MTRKEKLIELAEKCENGDVDFTTDAQIHVATEFAYETWCNCPNADNFFALTQTGAAIKLTQLFDGGYVRQDYIRVQSFTTSTDAVKLLEEKQLPKLIYLQCGMDCDGVWWAELCTESVAEVKATAPTEPLARIAALLKCLADMEGD